VDVLEYALNEITQSMERNMSTRKRRSSKSNGNAISYLKRVTLLLLAAGAIAFQVSSCNTSPLTTSTATPTGNAVGSSVPIAVPSKAAAARFSSCRQFFAGGQAPVVPMAPLLRELCYDDFAVLHSGETRTPVFVAQRLNRQTIQDARGEQRTDRFFADARLPRGERAELEDYKGSGYSRGHMAPAADMPNPTAMAQSFSLANMVPQNQQQNAGPWSKIEQDTRRYAMRAKGDVYIITGPVFGPDSPAIGFNRVRVPTHIFKLVYDSTERRAWAHWQPNTNVARAGAPISYAELTQRIGIELLPNLALK
jgi:endonuclease G